MSLAEKAKARYKKAQAVRKAGEQKARAEKKKVKFSRKKLTDDIMFEAKVLGRHPGAAKIVTEKVADEVEKWAKEREFITEDDIRRTASAKLKKYDEDLAYIYKNYGKII